MDFFRKLNLKTNIEFFRRLYEFVEIDSNYDSNVSMCWTENKKEFENINVFVDKITTKLNCKISRSCYTIQHNDRSHLPIHIDKDDSIMEKSIHGEIYSLIIPIQGSAYTKFYSLHEEDIGPYNMDINERYELYMNDKSINEKLKICQETIIDSPTILNISNPHSVEMIESPRVTYHVKLLQCNLNIYEIEELLNAL